MRIHCKYDVLEPWRKLKPHPKNRNKHTTEQIERLAKLIEYQGCRAPIVVSKLSGYIVKGHGTLMAMQQILKAENNVQVPVVYQDFESEEQEYAFLQSDNAIAAWAELDLAGINADIGDLGPDFDIDLLGIEGFEIEPTDKSEEDPDATPSVPVISHVKHGELFLLGKHRLLCGDSTNPDDVRLVMNGEKADMLCWDPPFNVGFDYQGEYKGKDNKSPQEYGNFIGRCIVNFRDNAEPEYDCFVWQGMRNLKYFFDWFPEGWRLISVAKNFVQSRPTWLQWATDPVIAWSTREEKNPVNMRDWFLANTANTSQTEDRNISGAHPCPRSIDVCEYFINWSKAKAKIMDLSLGSGSTLIACEKTNRKCFGVEIDPLYCDVILDRFAKFTGKDPIREDGTPWSTIKSDG